MNKLLVGTVLVLGASVVIAPTFIGSQVESQIRSAIDTFDTAPEYKVTLEDVKSGWFTTTGKINITVDFEKLLAGSDTTFSPDDLPNISFDLDLSAQHGPVLLTKGLGIGIAAVSLTSDDSAYAEFIEKTSDAPLYTHNGTLFFNGAYQFDIVSLPFSLKAVDSKVESSQLKGTISANSMRYDWQFGGGYANHEQVIFEIGDINLSGSSQTGYQNFLSGNLSNADFAASVANVVLNESDAGALFTINDIKLSGASRLSNNNTNANIEFRYDVKNIDFDEFKLDDLVFEVELNKLSVEALNQFQALSRRTAGLPPDQLLEKYNKAMQTILLDLVTQEPELNIPELSFKIGGGKFESSLYSNITQFDSLPENINDSSFWIRHINLQSQAKFEAAALRHIVTQVLDRNLKPSLAEANLSQDEYNQILDQQVDATVAALEAGGTFNKEGELYQYHFALKDGQALLNGNPMPISLSSDQP